MRVQLFTLRDSATLGGFDDTPLQQFTREREVLAFREHFFTVSDVPHLTCVLLVQDAVIAAEDLAAAKELAEEQQAERETAAGSSWSPPAEGLRKGGGRGTRSTGKRRAAPDPTEGLSEPDRVLFNTLHTWRVTKARGARTPCSNSTASAPTKRSATARSCWGWCTGA